MLNRVRQPFNVNALALAAAVAALADTEYVDVSRALNRAGMREHRQQVFDDFAAAADWLGEEGHTSRDRLGIQGGRIWRMRWISLKK